MIDPDGRDVRLLHVARRAPRSAPAAGDVEFLNVTLYTARVDDMIAFYRDRLGLVPNHEEPGHLCVMGHVAVHDPSEGPARSARLYFLADDATTFADRAHEVGAPGVVRADGYGEPAWHADLGPGFSIVVLAGRERAVE